MASIKQYYLENPISKEVYVADISDDCYIVGIYGPLHHSGVRKEYLGKYGTNTDDVQWAMEKEWNFLMLDNSKPKLIIGFGMEIKR